MNKEEIISFLEAKKSLTAEAQDARHEVHEGNVAYDTIKKQFKSGWIMLLVGTIIAYCVFSSLNGLISLAWFAIMGLLIYVRIKQGNKAKAQINLAHKKLQEAQNKPEYIAGMQDFPDKFYSYWTIDRLVRLVQENRANSLQDAFNVAENQDFQNDQISLQQQHLSVAQSTNKMAKISAAANVISAFNSRD